ncbi:divergent protein kinase domain 2A-like [Mercenaria mercenaria]|uniref:divergent protein kinase domain 2A-like n=1 Tax=Mercenaria mercenaria TaxID=6596 RepID=UPI00234E4C56|nr:divergent protein kinase domain 2A-like [Mercenaria mercenaria]
MLPFATRNRKLVFTEGATSYSEGATEMISNISKSTFRLRRIPIQAKCFVFVLIIICIYLYGSIYLAWGQNRLTKEDFLEVHKCPACYGQTFCFSLFDDQFDLSGMSKYELFDAINVKNVHYANHKYQGHQVVLKKLAHDDEIKIIDDRLCKDAFRDPGCDLARRMVVSKTGKDIQANGLLPQHLKDTTFMFFCVTHKLIDRVMDRYPVIGSKGDQMSMDDKLQILYTAEVNPEPLMLLTFPASEGWPFPEYYGACGRYIVEEYNGKSLADFYDAPFEKRADLAYQMLKMADRLTSDPEWNLYWTDLAAGNFAVDPAGKLTYIDAENIVVVDKQASKIANKEHWNDLSESVFVECEDGHTDCLSFDVDKMCTHYLCDHNYYAVCRNMLSKYADDRVNGGIPHLLHDMPPHANDDWDLDNLLNECTRPHQSQGRIKAAHKLLQALDHLRNIPAHIIPDTKPGHAKRIPVV